MIIKNFLKPNTEYYKRIENMHVIAYAAVKNSCESIVESFVSRYENHFDIRRNLDKESIIEEFQIAVNGPSFAHCDGVVKEAMGLYWSKNKAKGGKDRWHFF